MRYLILGLIISCFVYCSENIDKPPELIDQKKEQNEASKVSSKTEHIILEVDVGIAISKTNMIKLSIFQIGDSIKEVETKIRKYIPDYEIPKYQIKDNHLYYYKESSRIMENLETIELYFKDNKLISIDLDMKEYKDINNDYFLFFINKYEKEINDNYSYQIRLPKNLVEKSIKSFKNIEAYYQYKTYRTSKKNFEIDLKNDDILIIDVIWKYKLSANDQYYYELGIDSYHHIFLRKIEPQKIIQTKNPKKKEDI